MTKLRGSEKEFNRWYNVLLEPITKKLKNLFATFSTRFGVIILCVVIYKIYWIDKQIHFFTKSINRYWKNGEALLGSTNHDFNQVQKNVCALFLFVKMNLTQFTDKNKGNVGYTFDSAQNVTPLTISILKPSLKSILSQAWKIEQRKKHA